MGIFGKKDDDEKKDRPKADFSNVKSGSSSTAPAPAPPPAPAPAPAAKTYVVAKGDSLWKIAERFYGSGNKWRQIFEANRDVLKDPDVIHPGQTLKIPDAS